MTADAAAMQAGQVPLNEALARIVRLVLTGAARTRPELISVSGLGRTVVTQRVEQALDLGLLAEGALAPSTGGRAPRALRFRSEAARILVAVFGVRTLDYGITDLEGNVLVTRSAPWDIAEGPESSLEFSAGRFDVLLGELGREIPVWGAAVGLPGPVEFQTGRPVAPPMMPGWDAFDVRRWIEERYDLPVWVDNDANLLAMGEYVHGGHSAPDLFFVKIGTGIGAGIIAGGEIQRGANGAAGDIGHIAIPEAGDRTCRCGQRGCLESVAAGWALAESAAEAARTGRSDWIAERLTATGEFTADDLARGVERGDPECLRLTERSARAVGESLATVVNLLNPGVVAVGGSIGRSNEHYLVALRTEVYRRSIALATRSLSIVPASLGPRQGVIGGASLVSSRLLHPQSLERWAPSGSPEAIDRTMLYRLSMR